MCYDRVCHAAEIAYLFGVESLTEFQFTYNEEELSSRLIKYWSNFAKYSDPNGDPSEKVSYKVCKSLIQLICKISK